MWDSELHYCFFSLFFAVLWSLSLSLSLSNMLKCLPQEKPTCIVLLVSYPTVSIYANKHHKRNLHHLKSFPLSPKWCTEVKHLVSVAVAVLQRTSKIGHMSSDQSASITSNNKNDTKTVYSLRGGLDGWTPVPTTPLGAGVDMAWGPPSVINTLSLIISGVKGSNSLGSILAGDPWEEGGVMAPSTAACSSTVIGSSWTSCTGDFLADLALLGEEDWESPLVFFWGDLLGDLLATFLGFSFSSSPCCAVSSGFCLCSCVASSGFGVDSRLDDFDTLDPRFFGERDGEGEPSLSASGACLPPFCPADNLYLTYIHARPSLHNEQTCCSNR